MTASIGCENTEDKNEGSRRSPWWRIKDFWGSRAWRLVKVDREELERLSSMWIVEEVSDSSMIV